MSLYSRLIDLRPLPGPQEYREAHEMTDESFGKGGSWEDVTSQFPVLNRDKELKAQFVAAAKYGLLLNENELNDRTYSEDVPHYLVGRAFAQGFFQQITPSQLVYSSKYSLANGLSILNAHYAAQDFEKLKDKYAEEATKERIKTFNSQYVYALGTQGLSKIGEGASDYIERWADDAYPADVRLSRAFCLGHGAMIMCAMKYQAGLNEYLIGVASQSVNLDDEAMSIFSNDTTEES